MCASKFKNQKRKFKVERFALAKVKKVRVVSLNSHFLRRKISSAAHQR